ncbi:MAG: LPXTG cell wall anchor domain-containing protein [Lachnospiraceae bacterium]
MVCGLEESAGHVHTEECYTQQTGSEPTCELEEHQHTEECSDEEGNLICGLEEHQHAETCYPVEEVLTCTVPEGEGAHTHTEECFEVQKTLVCEKPEVRLHTHTDECYEKIDPEQEYSEENRRLICEQLQVEEHVHTEDGGCLEIVEVTAVGEPVEDTPTEEAEVFTTDLGGENEEAEAEDAKDGEDAKDAEDGDEDSEEAKDEETKDAKTYELTKTYTGDGYTVTAEYNEDANIPEEAELIAEQITVDSDEEHYAKREAEYRKSTGDKNAVMKALFKVGFYVDGEEVEPETAVKLTIQLFDENGLPEGTPITVVHFAEKGTEVLDGSEAESGSTSFEMESFSDVAIGFKKADAKKASVTVSESFQYKDEAFLITFHVEGKAKFEETVDEGNTEDDAADEDWSVEEGENNGSASEDSETGADVSGEGVSVDQELGDEQMITLPSVEDADTDGTNGAVEDGTSGETGEGVGTGGLEFKVVPLEKGTPEYDAAVAYADGLNDGSQLLLIRVLSYGMYFGGRELNLSECQVTADIEPASELSDKAEKSIPDAITYLRDEGKIAETPEDPTEDDLQTEFAISALRMVDDKKAEEVSNVYLSKDNPAEKMTVALDDGIAIVSALTQANPNFIVQYYANLEKVAYNDDSLKVITSGSNTNELPVIDTEGGKLPVNGEGTTESPNGTPIRKLYVDTGTGKLKTKNELTEVYAERTYKYHKAPTIKYVNALIENSSYELKEVWVLKDGKNPESIVKEDWNVYPYDAEHLHFTNRELSGGVDKDETYVFIDENTVLRLVYDTTSKNKDFEATFYDYDIGDGKIYASQADAQNSHNGQQTSTQKNGTWYMKTNQQGINDAGNYKGSGTKLAFGNANTGSGLQHENWDGNLLNKHNGTQGGHPAVKGSYKGCTFGLAEKLVNGSIEYASGLAVPNLFNDGNAIGKTAYNNHSLKFNRVGDTHTLTAVNGTQTQGLDSFNHPSPNSDTTHYHIWTNNFWPMDSVESYGTNGHDMKFGDYVNREKYKFAGQAGEKGGSAAANGTFPWSDDGKDHNSYFGMHYKVEFDLVADYTGPLEYYFFGDDDMWVFLGDEDGNGKLVCDIGGVHSSVGEYLNLWDYINKKEEKIHRHDDEKCYENGKNAEPTCGFVDSKKFTLNFYYTERGESGSTCWMQFTLPSVSSLTPEMTENDYGHLKIDKDVVVNLDGEEYQPEDLFGQKDENGEFVKDQGKYFADKEFTFTISLQGPGGNKLKDDYAYIKYDKNGNPMTDGGGILAWETIANGEEFKLKDGEFIRIQYLPKGTTYTITEGDTEITGVVYSGTDIIADDQEGEPKKLQIAANEEREKQISGTIPENKTSEVKYTNKYSVYELPKTGGSGPIIYTIAGVLVIILGAGFMYRKKVRERRV